MAKQKYDSTLRPRKHLKGCNIHGRVGKYDLSEGFLWDDFTEEMLIEYATVMSPGTVKADLIGDLPAAINKLKKAAPTTDK